MNLPKVLVLLSTYNGERYLGELIKSILGQVNVDVSLLIRDDGSKDRTIDILRKYEANPKISVLEYGRNLGYAKSFWKLLQCDEKYEYYAFADQDDIWLPDKLENSINQIQDETLPALSTSSVIPVDAELNPLNFDPFPIHGPLNRYETLQHSILPGCTFVFNKKAKDIAAKYNGYMESHDWALYVIITYFGKIFYLEKPYILYRLHGTNQIGIDSRLQLVIKRLLRLLHKKTCARSHFAKDFLFTYCDDFSAKDYSIVSKFANYNLSLKDTAKLLFDRNFKGTSFKLYTILRRI